MLESSSIKLDHVLQWNRNTVAMASLMVWQLDNLVIYKKLIIPDFPVKV